MPTILDTSTPPTGKSLLRLIQDACNELGIQEPTQVVGNLDQQIKQLLALANAEGDECANESMAWGGWPALRQEHSFSLVADQDAYDFPSDLAFTLPDTSWDRTNRWRNLGPVSPQEWQALKSGVVGVGPRRRFRIMGGQIYIDPVPTAAEAGQTVAFEYISNRWAVSADGADLRTEWEADTDRYRLDDRSMILGLQWRWKRTKGLDYAEEKAAYQDRIDLVKARAGGSRSLSLNRRQLSTINDPIVPDTGIGL